MCLVHVPVDRYTTFYEVKGSQFKSENYQAEAENYQAEGRETLRLDFCFFSARNTALLNNDSTYYKTTLNVGIFAVNIGKKEEGKRQAAPFFLLLHSK